eukprot:765521-Hanusia_phi.AAC.17
MDSMTRLSAMACERKMATSAQSASSQQDASPAPPQETTLLSLAWSAAANLYHTLSLLDLDDGPDSVFRCFIPRMFSSLQRADKQTRMFEISKTHVRGRESAACSSSHMLVRALILYPSSSSSSSSSSWHESSCFMVHPATSCLDDVEPRSSTGGRGGLDYRRSVARREGGRREEGERRTRVVIMEVKEIRHHGETKRPMVSLSPLPSISQVLVVG